MLILFLFGLKRKIIIFKIIFYYYFLSLSNFPREQLRKWFANRNSYPIVSYIKRQQKIIPEIGPGGHLGYHLYQQKKKNTPNTGGIQVILSIFFFFPLFFFFFVHFCWSEILFRKQKESQKETLDDPRLLWLPFDFLIQRSVTLQNEKRFQIFCLIKKKLNHLHSKHKFGFKGGGGLPRKISQSFLKIASFV